MLEQALAENTAILRELLEILRAAPWHHITIAERYAQQKAIHDEPPLTPAETQAAALAIVADVKDASATVASSTVTFPAPVEVRYEDIVTRVQKLAAAGKRDLIVQALQAFGCANAKHLRPEQYAEFLATLDAAEV
jgi:hypothetical protein